MIVFITSGIILLIIGIFVIRLSVRGKADYSKQIERCTSTVEGTLIRYEKKEILNTRRNYNDIYYHAVYEYWIDDEQYEIESRIGKGYKDDSLIGQKKQILYNPNDYSESIVSGDDNMAAFKYAKILGIIFTALGLVDLLAIILYKILSR